MTGQWLTPFLKQCFVTTGVAFNVGQLGLVLAFTAILLPQLRGPGSELAIDDTTASWIAALPGFGLILGNSVIPVLMARYGRKTANLVSATTACIGWFCIVGAYSARTLIVARLLLGLSMGFTLTLGPILIGEYTSPRNRGSFLSTITLTMSTGNLIVHTVGSYLSWRITALICAVMTILNLFIIICSPESPGWLAVQGRHEDCRRIFRWLRGDIEEDELEKMIAASQTLRESKNVRTVQSYSRKIKKGLGNTVSIFKRKEFFKPIILVIHLYTMANWSGIHFLSAFALDTIQSVMATDQYVTLLVITMGVQRLVSNLCALYVVRRVKRRTLLFTTAIINILALTATSGYTYARFHAMLPFDHPMIGALLIHVHMFSMVTGTLSLPLVISGEVFPLRYRSCASGISGNIFSLQFFLAIKTALPLLNAVGVYGVYLIYAGMLTYCLMVTWILLPETKDRTLQDIEEEFRGKKYPGKLLSSESSKCLQRNPA